LSACPHQQRIAEELAQSRQRPAHGRLGQPHIAGRVGHVAPVQEARERRQQVEVDAG
jgi:hypothetical protein